MAKPLITPAKHWTAVGLEAVKPTATSLVIMIQIGNVSITSTFAAEDTAPVVTTLPQMFEVLDRCFEGKDNLSRTECSRKVCLEVSETKDDVLIAACHRFVESLEIEEGVDYRGSILCDPDAGCISN